MDSVKELAKQIAGYIKGKKTRAYDTAAEVRRIVGNTAYVHIPGGVPETPVKLTIDAKVGDTVQVRVANSTAWLVGNSTAPPTDDTKAKEADANAGKAMTKAKEAEAIAEEGLKEAQGTSNYFWHVDGSGAESGAHVTEVPQAEFQANPSGGNLLMRSNVIKIRQALNTLAEINADGMTVYSSAGVQRAQFGERISLGSPQAYHLEALNNGVTGVQMGLVKRDSAGEITDAPSTTLYAYDGHMEMTCFRTPNVGIRVGTSNVSVDAFDNNVFVLETHQILSSQAIAGGAHIYDEVTITKAGYYPLCIAGWNAPNAVFVPSRLRLKDMAVGSATVAYDICNPRSSSSTSNFNADILWLKVSV